MLHVLLPQRRRGDKSARTRESGAMRDCRTMYSIGNGHSLSQDPTNSFLWTTINPCRTTGMTGSEACSPTTARMTHETFSYDIPTTAPLFANPRPSRVVDALELLKSSGSREERGSVYTDKSIVLGMLDLAEWVSENDLCAKRLLDPSAGDGEFFLPAVKRLLVSAHNIHEHFVYKDLSDSLRAVELHRPTFEALRERVIVLLIEDGASRSEAVALSDAWLINDDFLLTEFPKRFNVVVGNPPYVRRERVPAGLVAHYQKKFTTLYDRWDLYIPFYEHGLRSLEPNGRLVFICANRWLKNRYGKLLREFIHDHFQFEVFIDLEQCDAFQEDVDAYPAITVLRANELRSTSVAQGHRNRKDGFEATISAIRNEEMSSDLFTMVLNATNGAAPILFEDVEVLQIIRKLEARFRPLENHNISVGIGVATGADRIFIAKYDELDVEDERKLPLVKAADLTSPTLQATTLGVVNPWLANGELANLDDWPRFGSFLCAHESRLKKRHTARKNLNRWYKTIDKIYPELTYEAKLLVPDIKGSANVVFDPGLAYPHHNLYTIRSETWNLRALQAILRSSIALCFIAAYSTKMAGGYLRFQAQYLRRICVPSWESISAEFRKELVRVASTSDQSEIDRVVNRVFNLSDDSAASVSRFASNARRD